MNSDERILQILANSACLSKGQLLGYMRHTLYPEELRAVELHLSTCSLCNDALEGLETQVDTEQLLASLVPPVLPYVTPKEKPKEKKEPVPVIRQEKPPVANTNRTPATASPAATEQGTVQRLRPGSRWGRPVGIAALLVLGTAALWYFVVNPKTDSTPQLAQQQQETTDKTAAPVADSANPQLAAAMQAEEQRAALAAKEQKHKDSLLLARQEVRQKARKDSLARIAALRRTDTLTDGAMARSANAAKESTRVASEDVVARKAVAAAAPAPKKEEKKDEPKESKKVLSDFELGMQKYKEKNYASALLYFKSAESDKGDPRHWDAVYYSALCNKNLDKRRKAIKLFERVVDANAPQKKAAQKQLDELQKK
ncbi:hypothetical protein [Taibaiella koreensis]|uniref:hypothetical protein n=1 Tax=Taibaiella koreensis TaxID=1268548 RepID=UPI000E5994AE|nr:hypothetical protein [Taibaiella koreensis]